MVGVDLTLIEWGYADLRYCRYVPRLPARIKTATDRSGLKRTTAGKQQQSSSKCASYRVRESIVLRCKLGYLTVISI